MTIIAKRIAFALLILPALFTAASCSAMLETEYISITYFEEEAETEVGVGIDNYSSLLLALGRLVDEHTQSDKIILNNYSGNISTDLARACAEVRTTTPMGAYAVDYISYDPSRIVSYYEVKINIVYKKTKEQVDGILRSASSESVRQAIEAALAEGVNVLAINPRSGILGEDALKEMVLDEYMKKPLLLPKAPELSIKVFPESGMDRIFELSFDYGFTEEQLTEYREDMRKAVEEIIENSGASNLAGAEAAYSLFTALYENCAFDEQAESDFGASAYGALLEGVARSQGIALAFKALSDKAGIPCTVIRGTMDSLERFWNMIEIEGEFFHIDVSAARVSGDAAFMRGDDYMRGRYEWSAGNHPVGVSDFYAAAPP